MPSIGVSESISGGYDKCNTDDCNSDADCTDAKCTEVVRVLQSDMVLNDSDAAYTPWTDSPSEVDSDAHSDARDSPSGAEECDAPCVEDCGDSHSREDEGDVPSQAHNGEMHSQDDDRGTPSQDDDCDAPSKYDDGDTPPQYDDGDTPPQYDDGDAPSEEDECDAHSQYDDGDAPSEEDECAAPSPDDDELSRENADESSDDASSDDASSDKDDNSTTPPTLEDALLSMHAVDTECTIWLIRNSNGCVGYVMTADGVLSFFDRVLDNYKHQYGWESLINLEWECTNNSWLKVEFVRTVIQRSFSSNAPSVLETYHATPCSPVTVSCV
jgi:hypothetical protein